MRPHLHRIPSVPHADWFDRNARFEHLRSLVEFRTGKPFRPESFRTYISPSTRPIPSNSSQSPDGLFTSRKCLAARYWEASHERYAFWILEADSRIRSYLHQPHILIMHFAGTVFHYSPDIEYLGGDGTRGIIETKYDYADATRDTNYLAKLVLAWDAYRRLGYKFELWTEVEDLQRSHGLRNARNIVEARYSVFDTTDELKLNRHFGAVGMTSTVEEVRATLTTSPLDHPGISAQKVYCAVIRRRLAIDIFSAPITPASTVQLLPASEALP